MNLRVTRQAEGFQIVHRVIVGTGFTLAVSMVNKYMFCASANSTLEIISTHRRIPVAAPLVMDAPSRTASKILFSMPVVLASRLSPVLTGNRTEPSLVGNVLVWNKGLSALAAIDWIAIVCRISL